MPRCQNCGYDVPGNQGFCSNCGAPSQYPQPGPMPYGQYPPPVQPRKRSGCGTGCIIAAIIGVVLLGIGLVVGYNYVKNYDWASSMEPSCTQDYDY